MTNHIDPGKVQSVLDIFDRMDAEHETAAPDDDPEFLRELDRRTRRDDGSPA